MKRLLLYLLLLCVPTGILVAQDTLHGWSVSGFGFLVWQSTPANGFNLKHLWLIGDKALAENLDLKIMAALAGPPKIAHTLSLQWKRPLPFIGHVRIGRFDPPFGWDFWEYRIRLWNYLYDKHHSRFRYHSQWNYRVLGFWQWRRTYLLWNW